MLTNTTIKFSDTPPMETIVALAPANVLNTPELAKVQTDLVQKEQRITVLIKNKDDPKALYTVIWAPIVPLLMQLFYMTARMLGYVKGATSVSVCGDTTEDINETSVEFQDKVYSLILTWIRTNARALCMHYGLPGSIKALKVTCIGSDSVIGVIAGLIREQAEYAVNIGDPSRDFPLAMKNDLKDMALDIARREAIMLLVVGGPMADCPIISMGGSDSLMCEQFYGMCKKRFNTDLNEQFPYVEADGTGVTIHQGELMFHVALFLTHFLNDLSCLSSQHLNIFNEQNKISDG